MEKINIAEILKNCPEGMELDCTIFDNVVFERVDLSLPNYPIVLKRVKEDINFFVTKYGQCCDSEDCKCAIFPKGKTTWKGFTPPCQFKDGDVVVDDSGAIFIYKQIHTLYREPYADFYCGLTSESRRFKIKTGAVQRCGEISSVRYATEGEKQMLFNAIKANGYYWNAEKKTLKKLFKVGDRIRHKKNNTIIKTIGYIYDDGYALYDGHSLFFREQDEWELVPNKFDINTLKPFVSRVLVRNDENQRWMPSFWGYKVVDGFITTFGWSKYCIPFEYNAYLLGTTNDCGDFYKTWEK